MNDDELFMNDKQTRYDSLVNDINNPTIFVINRDYQCCSLFYYFICFATKINVM